MPKFRISSTSGSIARSVAALTVATVTSLGLAMVIAEPAQAAAGDLTEIECIANAGAGGCFNPALDSLGQARGVATSPDGNNVYVAGFGGDSITTFDRAAATGQLTEAGRIADAETNDSMKPILGGRRWLRISPTPKSCTPLDAPGEVK